MEKITVFENELVPVYVTDKGEHVVNGRELWEVLKSKQQYSDWIKNRFEECEAVENEDFEVFQKFMKNPKGGRPATEYIIKLDTAKEMAMLERNEIGKAVRKYFIRIEKKYIKSQKKPPATYKEALQQLIIEIEEKEKLEAEKLNLQAKIEEDRPKVVLADAITVSDTSILVREFAKVLMQNKINMGGNKFYDWLRENSYLIKAKGKDYNTPTQRAMKLKLFEVQETPVYTPYGAKLAFTTYITAKGQQYFINKLKKINQEQLTLY